MMLMDILVRSIVAFFVHLNGVSDVISITKKHDTSLLNNVTSCFFNIVCDNGFYG